MRPLHPEVRRRGLDAELLLQVPSDLGVVGEAVEVVAHHCLASALTPRRVLFNLRTALAEALSNAIIYGNAEDPSTSVDVRVELSREAVRIHVTDRGIGFDRSHLPDPTTPENIIAERGRGLFVMRHLVDRVDFNEQGNSVCLILRAR